MSEPLDAIGLASDLSPPPATPERTETEGILAPMVEDWKDDFGKEREGLREKRQRTEGALVPHRAVYRHAIPSLPVRAFRIVLWCC